MSRAIGILSFLALLATAGATFLGGIAPEYAVWLLAFAAAANAFTERIHGGESVDGQRYGDPWQEGFISREPTRKAGRIALGLNIATTVATVLGAVKPNVAAPVLTGIGVVSAITGRVGAGGVSGN